MQNSLLFSKKRWIKFYILNLSFTFLFNYDLFNTSGIKCSDCTKNMVRIEILYTKEQQQVMVTLTQKETYLLYLLTYTITRGLRGL